MLTQQLYHRKELVNKVKSNADEKIVTSKCQIEANNDGTSASGKIENKNSLPKQHAKISAGSQKATSKMERPATNKAQTLALIAIFPSSQIAVKK